MNQIPLPHSYYARREATLFGKVITTLFSLLTIAAILFIGTRDWKSGSSFLATLTDTSELQSFFAAIRKDDTSKTSNRQPEASRTTAPIRDSLIDHGTLVRSGSSPLLAGEPSSLPDSIRPAPGR